MNQNAVEAIIGAVVLAVAAFFLFFAYTGSDLSADTEGYRLEAAFFDAGGLAVGTDVRASGVKIGTISDIRLDPASYQAVVTMSISETYHLPLDTVALVTTDGLLGDPYISMEIGGDPETLQDGERMEFAQSQPNLTQLIGQAIYSFTSGDGSNDSKENESDPMAEMP